MKAKQWFDKGQLIEENGRNLFVIDSKPLSSKPVLVILHGYPTFSCV